MKGKRIPNSLKKYRKQAGLKQKEVAKIIGLKSSSLISRWERGICFPKPLNMFKLAILYQTMVDALFYDVRRALIEEIKESKRNVMKEGENMMTKG
jgi:transcriptional regulator with XRE-family HTH domain